MEAKKSEKHIFNTELVDKPNYKISVEDLILDLKVLLKEYYCGTFTNNARALKIKLNNGQKFLLNLIEFWFMNIR